MKDTTLQERSMENASSPRGVWSRMKNAWQESETYLDESEQAHSAHENADEAYFSGSPYVGEIQIFAGNFAPDGWMFCHGQLLSIAEESTLFALIGTTYGGDGQITFALPDLRGRMPIHQGTGPGLSTRVLGETGGTETVALTANQIPTHTHSMTSGVVRGGGTQGVGLTTGTELGTLTAPTTSSTGGSQPHENMPPFLGLNFIISLYGIFPPSP